MVRDPALAEDILQTIFLQAYKGLGRFQGRSSLRTWLMGIARHRCLDAIKARRRWGQTFEPGEPPPSSAATEDPVGRLALSQSLETCLGKLEDNVRDTVLLRYIEGFSYPEMEQICGEKAATLQMRVGRALPVLRRCLESRGVRL
jgi:RNA polymerase sigma-70 factor (ECF subfamily)